MGHVWKAHDPILDRDVAIKVSAQEFGPRFEREARAVAALNHPNICQIYDIGSDYLVMEYVDGSPPRGPLAPEEALRLALGIAAGLEAAHAKGIIHRDLKPANILVTPSGVKLLDFGLALMKNGQEATVSDAITGAVPIATPPGTVLGTPGYMSPEQASGLPLDERSDVFSFGAVLYELVSGKRAFGGHSGAEVLCAVLRDEPERVVAPACLVQIITRCLRKKPAERFQSMKEVRSALEQGSPTRPDETPSIAVLPFANISPEKENEYFADGLTEEILNLLAKIPGLKVIARSSAFAFKGRNEDVRRIGHVLGVNNVLEGSVRRAGNRVRVTAELINASDATHLWAEHYDRDLTDIFAIQDEIGQAISEALKLQLGPRSRLVNIEVYQNYLKGQYHRARSTLDSLLKAEEFFEKTIAIDAGYAPAYAGLAGVYAAFAAFGVKPASELAPAAKSAAGKALAIDPANSDAHGVFGYMAAAYDYDWNAAEKHYRAALAARPVPALVRIRYIHWYLLPLGLIQEAIEQSRLGLETDPLSMPLHTSMTWSMCHAKRYQEAIDYARGALEIDANYYLLLLMMGLAQLGADLAQEAVISFKRVVELAPWFHLGSWTLALATLRVGEREQGQELARNLAASFGDTVGAALYYAAVGNTDALFESLEGAYRQRDVFLLLIQCPPFFDQHRADPRFQSLIHRMNLAPGTEKDRAAFRKSTA